MLDTDAPALAFSSERPEDAAEAEALVERAFGPGRYAKAAERLREGNHFLPQLSFIARAQGVLVGTVRLWPVKLGGRNALLLGPIAVDETVRRQGVGLMLVERCCAAAADAGHELLVLVGDLGFFQRAGFERAAGVHLPGPADSGRILVKGLTPGALDGVSGAVTLP